MSKFTRPSTKTLLFALVLLGLTACSEPIFYFSGARLQGEETTLLELPSSSGVMQLETLPADPYSVNIGYFLHDGKLYIDPAEDRQWYQNILLDPNVRIRFEGSELIHPMLTVPETDPEIIAQFDAQRIILRLEPR